MTEKNESIKNAPRRRHYLITTAALFALRKKRKEPRSGLSCQLTVKVQLPKSSG